MPRWLTHAAPDISVPMCPVKKEYLCPMLAAFLSMLINAKKWWRKTTRVLFLHKDSGWTKIIASYYSTIFGQ
ncbi:MAG: hypothetical protein AB9Q18_10960, partial [Candidatus Reddybacter sp.]